MLVDLETAKVELDLANQRAEEAATDASELRLALAASELATATLESRLQSSHTK
jgi:hypothetical protein